MSGLELNKIAASVLVAGLIAMGVSKITGGLYHPVEKPEKRGFEVAVAEAPAPGQAAAPEQPVDLAALLKGADAEKGKEIAKKCMACHDFSKGGPNKVGPNLWGIVGNHKAHAADFAYSDAMKNFPVKEWSYEELYQFINSPRKHIPGTKMGFAGLSNPQEIANVIAFLRTVSDNPPPLPK